MSCPECSTKVPPQRITEWIDWGDDEHNIWLKCNKCGHRDTAFKWVLTQSQAFGLSTKPDKGGIQNEL